MKTQKTWIITGASRGFGNDIIKTVLAAGDKVWQRYALNGMCCSSYLMLMKIFWWLPVLNPLWRIA
jgi:hypothetical protein